MTVPVAALREMIAQANADHDWVNDGCCPGLCRRCRARNSLAYTIWPTAASLLCRLDRAEAVVAALIRLMEALPPGQKWVDAMRNAVETLAHYRAEGEEVGG